MFIAIPLGFLDDFTYINLGSRQLLDVFAMGQDSSYLGDPNLVKGYHTYMEWTQSQAQFSGCDLGLWSWELSNLL